MDSMHIAMLCSGREEEVYAEDMLSNIPIEMKRGLSFINLKRNSEEGLGEFSARCIEKVKNDKIDHVISLTDLMAIVHAKICSEIPRIRGPSLDSVMAAMNKYRARETLMENGGGVKYVGLDLNATSAGISEAVKHVGLPAMLKPFCLHHSLGIKKIENQSEVEPALRMIKELELKYWKQCDFSGVCEDTAAVDGAILEEFIESRTLVAAEGCVVSGEGIHWAITGVLLWPSQISAPLGSIYPSNLSAKLQDEIWRQYDGIVNEMMDLGFDNQFLHVEMFVMADDSVKIAEINHRLSTIVGPLYRECLRGGNVGIALVNMSRGVIPEVPRWNGIYGLAGVLVTFKSGKTKELIDFERAKTIDGVLLIKHPDEDIVYLGDDGGSVIVYVNIFGINWKEVFAEFISTSRSIIQQPEYGPLEITDGFNEEFLSKHTFLRDQTTLPK